jgi:hypothetical protein
VLHILARAGSGRSSSAVLEFPLRCELRYSVTILKTVVVQRGWLNTSKLCGTVLAMPVLGAKHQALLAGRVPCCTSLLGLVWTDRVTRYANLRFGARCGTWSRS